ncbi:MAG: lipopolysaccharide biosynthesis protein [Gemmatimonadetes bacterium]|nr:lipopolysaccharide biosynthesis protein [Gemmatimonadota bacterium]
MTESLTRRSAGAALWTASGAIAKIVLKLGVLGVLARLVEPREFGLVASALIIIDFFQIFVRVGVGPVIVQRRELTERHIRTAFWISVAFGVAFPIVTTLVAPALAHGLFRSETLGRVLVWAALVLPFHSLAVVPLALLQRDLKFAAIVRLETIAYALGFAAVSIALAVRGFGVWALVAGHLAEAVLLCVLALSTRSFPKRPIRDLQAAREIAFFGSGFAVARGANWLALAGDKWVVGRWLGQASLGLYKYAYELATLPGNLLGQVLDRVLFPAMARVQDDPIRLARAYRGGLALVGCAVWPASLLIVALADELVAALLGPNWAAVADPLRILAAAAILRSGLKLTDSLVRATGAVYRRAWRQIGYAIAILAGAYGGAFFGLRGAAVGVVGGAVVGWGLMLHLGVSLTGLRGRDSLAATFRALPLGLIAGGLALGVRVLLAPLAWPAVIVLVSAAMVAGAGVATCALTWPRLFLGADALAVVRGTLGALPRRPRLLRRILASPASAARA